MRGPAIGALGWLSAAAAILGGLELATRYRTPGVPVWSWHAWLAWYPLWAVGGGLAVAALTRAIYLVLPALHWPQGAAAGLVPGVLAGLVSVLVVGSSPWSLLLIPLTTLGVQRLVDREAQGWGALAAWVWATNPVVLGAGASWPAISAGCLVWSLLAAERQSPVGLVGLAMTALLDPLAGFGASAFCAASQRSLRWIVVPLLCSLWPLSQQAQLGNLLLDPATALIEVSVSIGLPWGVLMLLGATPRWLAVATAIGVATVFVGLDGDLVWIVPVLIGGFLASVRILPAQAVRALWLATFVVLSVGFSAKRFQTDQPGGILHLEDR